MSQREHYLHEMGLGPLWKRRPTAADPATGAESAAAESTAESAVTAVPVPAPAGVVATAAEPAFVAALHPANVTAAEPVAVVPGAGEISTLDWPALEETIRACRACRLCEKRKQAVPGVGDRQADWLFVGEGPGAEEDQRGEPFVGQAGKLLDAMLAAIGLARGQDVYIANSVKCRPPENRTPEPEETAACWPYLERQIALIQPRLIVALGRPAAQTLLQTEIKIGSARGRLFDYRGIPVIVTYHPAYLLRNLTDKAKAWEDLVFARRTMKSLKES